MQLSPDFRELRGVGASDLLYVKEDIILPHSQSFYDLIVNQVTLIHQVVTGRSGADSLRNAVLNCACCRDDDGGIPAGVLSVGGKIGLKRSPPTGALQCSALDSSATLQARGKSGPLFHFDVHEDVRLVNDASREKDESHAGKVVERHWYNRWVGY